MAAELPYLQLFPADYLRDTRILSLPARGAWMDLMCAMWHPSKRGVLDMRLSALARLIGTTETKTAKIISEIESAGVADVIRCGDQIKVTCRRIVRDWSDTQAFRNERSESGRKGAAKRWGHDSSANGSAIKQPLAKAWPPSPPPSPIPEEAEAAPPSGEDLDMIQWHGLSGEEALALLGRHFPDRDVWGEYQRFKQVRADQGRKPDWRGLIAWLRKAAPVADLGRKKPAAAPQKDPDGWRAWLAEAYPQADPETKFADAPDNVRREFQSRQP